MNKETFGDIINAITITNSGLSGLSLFLFMENGVIRVKSENLSMEQNYVHAMYAYDGNTSVGKMFIPYEQIKAISVKKA